MCGLHAYAGTNYSYNNTFDSNDVGLWFYRCLFYAGSMTVKESLFTLNGEGIRRSGSSGGLTTDYNACYGNGENVWDAETSQTLSIGSNSLALVNSPYDPGSLWWDRYRLNRDGPVIDAGSVLSSDANRELATFTTDKDDASDSIRPDIGQVDIGYHYPLAWSDPGWTSIGIDHPWFTTSVTLTVNYDPSSSEWALQIWLGESKIYDSDFSSGSSKTWTPSGGQSDGEYQYKIIRDVPGTGEGEDEDDEFITGTIVRDRAAPTDLVITWPQNGQSVIGL